MKNNFLKKLLHRFKTLTDQDIDKLYYNQYAQSLISRPIESYRLGLKAVPFNQQKIFEKYYDAAIMHIAPNCRILELGAGVGVHTGILASRIRGGGELYINDISEISLDVNKKLHPSVNPLCSSMNSINLPSDSVDIVFSCGSLSYEDPETVDIEIKRLLKPFGKLIVLDSLKHNLIYRINRLARYILGNRTLNSVNRIPNINRISNLSKDFESVSLFYYGSYLWFIKPISLIIGENKANELNDVLEKRWPSQVNAFKFVLICTGFKKFKW
jgi:ubiquinone/menaquinone biosynthesis C-methylase UbiE